MKMKFNLATKITIARIFLIIPTIAAFIYGQLFEHGTLHYLIGNIVAAVLFSICCSTDFLDGYIARKTGTVTDLGKLLDPLADKVVIVIMLFLVVLFRDGLNEVFAYNALVVALLSGIILSRELLISVFRSIAARKNCVLAADIFGKIKTVLLDVSVTCLMLAGMHVIIGWVGTVIFYLGAVVAVYSGINYIVKNRHVFESADAEEQSQDESVNDNCEQLENEYLGDLVDGIPFNQDSEYDENTQSTYDLFEKWEKDRELLSKLERAKQNIDEERRKEEEKNRSVNFEEFHRDDVVTTDTNVNTYHAPIKDLFEGSFGGNSEQPFDGQFDVEAQDDINESNPASEAAFGELMCSQEFEKIDDTSTFAVGKDGNGIYHFASLKDCGCLLVVGTVESGKSSFLRSMVASLICKASPDDLRFILIDAHNRGSSVYDGMPHLLVDEIISDSAKAERAIAWAIQETKLRLDYLKGLGYRDIDSYNEGIKAHGKSKMPRIVIVADGFDSLVGEMNKNVVQTIAAITRLGRSAGVHLVLSVHRVNYDILGSSVINNIPVRVVFKTATSYESRNALGCSGAEQLAGKGDMLFSTDSNHIERMHGVFTNERDAESLIGYVKAHNHSNFDSGIRAIICDGELNALQNAANDTVDKNGKSDSSDFFDAGTDKDDTREYDMQMLSAIKAVVEMHKDRGHAHVAGLQRKLGIGYPKAVRLFDELEYRGIIERDYKNDTDTYVLAIDVDTLDKVCKEFEESFSSGSDGDME